MTSVQNEEETTEAFFTKLVNKRVRLVYVPEGPGATEGTRPVAEEIIAYVQAYNEANKMLMVRQKGRTMGFLLEVADVVEIETDEDDVKPIKQKKLKAVDTNTVRQHLADRHGYELTHVNSLTDEQAEEEHDAIDHGNLGHTHQEETPESEDTDSDDSE